MASAPRNPIPDRGRRVLGGAMLSGALALIVLAGAVIFWPRDSRDAAPAPPAQTAPPPLGIAAVDYPTPIPTLPPTPTLPPVDWVRPTADPQAIVAALDVPAGSALAGGVIAREINPLTIIPQRSRSTVITYTVKKNDNLRSIAGRFGLSENTIIWSNDRFYVNAMRIGLELNILPVDGVYHRVQQPQPIADIAAEYAVDPYDIIDSEYNTLFGAAPQTILPEGLWVVVPGGTGSTEPIYWDPGIVMTTTTTDGSNPVGTGVNAGADVASFAVGDPGSCGRQVVAGGSAPVGAPIWARYKITQDFSWNHGGIDLAVPPGTPVYAAGGGTVIFSGWSTWGYGYTVVIAHGGTLSVYGHLNGAFVGCGQVVTAGQNIAVTGSSGRSSGPHLHFEIRGSGGAPVNPWNYQSF
ncbi:MAG: M23 family metallopeptidase [Anaerolineae bacterium]|nr:M23 family metallopeptidase [Anaerolineae bacterium]